MKSSEKKDRGCLLNLEQFGTQLLEFEFGEVWVCDDCKKQLASPYQPKLCTFCEKEHTVNKMQIRGASNEARE